MDAGSSVSVRRCEAHSVERLVMYTRTGLAALYGQIRPRHLLLLPRRTASPSIRGLVAGITQTTTYRVYCAHNAHAVASQVLYVYAQLRINTKYGEPV